LRREIWLFSGDLLAVPGVVGAAAVGTIPIPTQQASETGKTEETNPSPIAVALAADVSPHILRARKTITITHNARCAILPA